jgi:hypothetical protein
LFLITESDDQLGGEDARAGMFENPSPDDVEFATLWPVIANSALEPIDMWAGWKFSLVELGAPLPPRPGSA